MPKIPVLKKRREFLAVRDKGDSAAGAGVVLQVLKSQNGGIRVGYTVTAKVGNAVERNRIKRRMRAVAAEVLPTIAGNYDFVLIGRRGALKLPYAKLLNDLRNLLKRLVKTS